MLNAEGVEINLQTRLISDLLMMVQFVEVACWLGERLGSGDGESKTLLTRQIAFEPLPASVLLALGLEGDGDRFMMSERQD